MKSEIECQVFDQVVVWERMASKSSHWVSPTFTVRSNGHAFNGAGSNGDQHVYRNIIWEILWHLSDCCRARSGDWKGDRYGQTDRRNGAKTRQITLTHTGIRNNNVLRVARRQSKVHHLQQNLPPPTVKLERETRHHFYLISKTVSLIFTHHHDSVHSTSISAPHHWNGICGWTGRRGCC